MSASMKVPKRSGLRRQRGFSLIELMVGMLLGLFLLGGIIAVFIGVGSTGRSQQALARVLENGRFGSQLLQEELRMAGNQYCSSYSIDLPTPAGLNSVRPIMMNSTGAGRPVWMPTAPSGTRYPVDPSLFLRGYDCGASTCSPTLPTAAQDVNVVPAMGSAAGNRAPNTDVITIRYLADVGVRIQAPPAAGGTGPVVLPVTGATAPLSFANGDLAMIADCGAAELFATTTGTTASIEHRTADGNYVATFTAPFSPSRDSRIFNFTRDFLSVTYFVRIDNHPQEAGRLLSSLYRIVNGGAPQLVIEGVDRFDVTFVVLDGSGNAHYLNAQQVNTNPTALACPPAGHTTLMTPPRADCLWRSVQGIEVSMLINSVLNDAAEFSPFRYSPAGNAFQSFAQTAAMPNGIPAGRKIRREFRFLATVHSFAR